MLASFSSNYNPSNTFANLTNRADDFRVMANIGRLYRQLKAEPDPTTLDIDESNIGILEGFINLLPVWDALPWKPNTPETKELYLWVFAMRMVCDYQTWLKFLENHKIDNFYLFPCTPPPRN